MIILKILIGKEDFIFDMVGEAQVLRDVLEFILTFVNVINYQKYHL